MQPDELKRHRKNLGMTQAQLADALDVSTKLILEMEKGRMGIERRTALSVAHLVYLASIANDAPA